MKKFLSFILLLSVVMITRAQVLLRYDLQKGKNYPTVFEVIQSIDQTIMGAEQSVDSRQTMEMDMHVKDVKGEMTELAVSYTRVIVRQKSPLGEINYDSDSAESKTAEGAVGYAALVDNGFGVSFNSLGIIEKVSGLDAMIERMISHLDINDSLQKAETIRIVKEQFDEEVLASQIQNSLAIFPEEEIKIGDSWTVDQSVTTPFPMEVLSTYLLTDYDDTSAYISVDSQIATGQNSRMENAEMRMNVEISGNQNGTMTIDRKTGMILESSIIQRVTGTIYITSPQEMSWPIELETEVIVTGKF